MIATTAKGMDMSLDTLTKRNKNADKTLIDYDLNIYIPEEYDADTDDYYQDPANWRIQVYHVTGLGHAEWDNPILLSSEEIASLGFNRDPYFKDETDTWYGLEGFRMDYWSKMSDRLKKYFDSLPKYYEDIN